MIKEQARVISLKGSRAEIEVLRQSSCNHCELGPACGTGAIGRLLGNRSRPIIVDSEYPLKIGDSVTLGLPEGAFLSASLLIYGLALAWLLISALVGQMIFGDSEFLVVGCALLGFGGGLVISAMISKNKYARQLHPKILAINGEPSSRLTV